jgi:hypothetical protein
MPVRSEGQAIWLICLWRGSPKNISFAFRPRFQAKRATPPTAIEEKNVKSLQKRLPADFRKLLPLPGLMSLMLKILKNDNKGAKIAAMKANERMTKKLSTLTSVIAAF